MFNKRKSEIAHAPTATISEVPRPSAPQVPTTQSKKPKYDGQVVIGRGTKIVGEIQDCAVVEIQGAVEGAVSAKSLVILEGGQVTGQIIADTAEVHGAFSGSLKIENLLDVKSTGRVEGDLAYGQLAVAMGGNVVGNITNPVVGHAVAASDPNHAMKPDADQTISDLRAFRQGR